MADFTYYPVTTESHPPDFRPGILPRKDSLGESCALLRDAPGFNVIPRDQWVHWINDEQINISSAVWSVFNQGSVGSCASEALDGAFKICRELAGLPKVEFNPYATYGRVNGGYDGGSTLIENLQFLQKYGAFPEDVWPRSKGWKPSPDKTAYEAAHNYRLDEFYEISNWDEFATALLNGWVVYYGEPGHALVAVDLLNDRQFTKLNSWGKWGTGTKYSKIEYGFGVTNSSSIVWNYGVYAFRTPVIEAIAA